MKTSNLKYAPDAAQTDLELDPEADLEKDFESKLEANLGYQNFQTRASEEVGLWQIFAANWLKTEPQSLLELALQSPPIANLDTISATANVTSVLETLSPGESIPLAEVAAMVDVGNMSAQPVCDNIENMSSRVATLNSGAENLMQDQVQNSQKGHENILQQKIESSFGVVVIGVKHFARRLERNHRRMKRRSLLWLRAFDTLNPLQSRRPAHLPRQFYTPAQKSGKFGRRASGDNS